MGSQSYAGLRSQPTTRLAVECFPRTSDSVSFSKSSNCLGESQLKAEILNKIVRKFIFQSSSDPDFFSLSSLSKMLFPICLYSLGKDFSKGQIIFLFQRKDYSKRKVDSHWISVFYVTLLLSPAWGMSVSDQFMWRQNSHLFTSQLSHCCLGGVLISYVLLI